MYTFHFIVPIQDGNFFKVWSFLYIWLIFIFLVLWKKFNYNFCIYWCLKTVIPWAIYEHVYYICTINLYTTIVHCNNSLNLVSNKFLSCISTIYVILQYNTINIQVVNLMYPVVIFQRGYSLLIRSLLKVHISITVCVK